VPLIRQGPGLLRGAARVGVAAGVAGRVQHRQQERWAAEDQANYEQQAAPAPEAAAGEADYTAELEKLAKLRDEGVISADDFEAKKKQLLGI
jgi:putative oligomerization/nucleic acid binding protein